MVLSVTDTKQTLKMVKLIAALVGLHSTHLTNKQQKGGGVMLEEGLVKRERVDPKCNGCPRIYTDFEGNEFCTTYLTTSHWWRKGKCPFHPSVLEDKKVEEKKKMGWKRSRNE